jgi:hypothetical protein
VGDSDGFHVDPEALSEAHAGVGRLLRDLGEFTDLGPDHPSSVFGHSELAESTAEFRARWQGGVRDLSRDLESILGRLGETADEYRRADLEAAAEFRRLRGEKGADGQ